MTNMMNTNTQRWGTVLVAILLMTPGTARPEDAGTPTFMWSVESGKAKVYLLGSVHVADESFYPLPAGIEEGFTASDHLVVEADITQPQSDAAIMAKMQYPEGKTLKTELPAEVYELLGAYLAAQGMPAAALDGMRPWAVSLTIVMQQAMKSGLNPQLGIDMHFLKKAKESELSILELESVDLQIGILSGFLEEVQGDYLRATLEDVDDFPEQMTKMVEAWRAGDVRALEDLTIEEFKERPELKPVKKALFDDRNLAMTEKIEGYLRTGDTYFVVVGAGHLIGEAGILALLEEAGYEVKRHYEKAAVEKEAA